MSWGTELWDQYENLSMHTQKGIDFLERYGHFIRDRCAIEMEYAGKLRRLVKSYQPKKKEEEDYQYSTCKAFKMMMNEVNDMAGQHEVIAENLQVDVIREVTLLIKDFKDDRKRLLAEAARLMTQLTNQIGVLERSRKNYEKAFKEAERALDNYQKADADLNLSRAEVEKQKMNMTMKSQQCEDTKNEYANQLQRTNEQQRQHYEHLMPEVFRQLQDLDEKRIRNIRNYMIQSVQVERNVFPIINQCLDGIVNASNQVNEKEDTMQVIERYKSGFEPPGDISFEDLSRAGIGDSNDGGGLGVGGGIVLGGRNHSTPNYRDHTVPMRPYTTTVKDTISASKLKKRVNLFSIFSSNKNNLSGNGDSKDDFSDLPPNQRKKKLQMKIDEIQAKIHQESAARDGLMKMKGVYEQNPNLGDPMSIEGQLNESGHRLDKLRQELHKFQALLDDTNGMGQHHHSTSNGGSGNNLNSNHSNGTGSGGSTVAVNGISLRHHSYDDDRTASGILSGGSCRDETDSLSRSASDSSVSANVAAAVAIAANNYKNSAPATPTPNHHGPESGIGASHSSLPDSDEGGSGGGGSGGGSGGSGQGTNLYYDAELLPPLGTCKALYPFEATSEGSIDMDEGEELLVIETDQGDGWTRVRRPQDLTEGFVPTSYILANLNSGC